MEIDLRCDEVVVERLVADLVGAQPGSELLSLIGDAGSPELIIALVGGLVEEGLVHVDADRAVPSGALTCIPRRVLDWVQGELAGISRLARHAAVATATLGELAHLEHIAALLDRSVGALLGPVEELMNLGMLKDIGSRLAFQSPLLREAVLETVAPSLRQGLQREAIEVLVRAGDSPIEPAVKLASSAEPGDRRSVAALVVASRMLEITDVEAAADMSVRAYGLTRPGDDQRAELACETAVRLHAAGRANEASDLVEEVLRERLLPEAEATIRLSVACMADLAPDVRAAMNREALALEISPALRSRHLAVHIGNIAAEGRRDLARRMFADVEPTVVASGDLAAVNALAAARAQLTYMDGSFRATLRLLEPLESATLGAHHADEHANSVRLLRGEALLALDEIEAADRLTNDSLSSALRANRPVAAKEWQRLQGRRMLHMGHIAEAAAILEPAFSAGAHDEVITVSDAATMAALGRIAIHLGEARRARSFTSIAERVLSTGAPELRRHAAWLLTLHASACGDTQSMRHRLEALDADEPDHLLPMLMVDPSDHPQLVRIARAAGDDVLARSAVASAEACVDSNPGAGSIEAAAAHARGLLERDPSEIARAIELLASGPRRIAHASAVEDYGTELARAGDQAAAIDAFGEALRIYTHSGALWDASRVRQRLREHGVRRRIVKPTRPTSGWAGLTDAEVAVVQRVAEGLTNREVAEQLYLSPHTVSMHLRHVFTKLNINSRVELARLAFERQLAA